MSRASIMPLKVVLKNFLNHFETLEARKKLGDDLFEAEFQSLKELTEGLKSDPQYASTEGQKEVNRRKNRYKDILPYNCTRVILSEYPGVPGSDYINANLIKGASGSKAYIASQGPLPTTVMDFWRMIWECEVQVIIMACNEKESGKYKCERYWPNEGETKQYGNITVELVKWKQVCPDFVLRTLRARCGQEERTICQFHYWTWPDHGVPSTVGPIVDLVRLVRDCQTSEALPVLVHCSAGCGRTGTICAIDYVWGLMRVGKLSESFSLYQIIREMRMQRVAMVQTKEQYVLVHRVVAALFEQQLRIIDSHTYENLDEDGEPLLGKGLSVSSDKIYENIDDLVLDKEDLCSDGENEEKCDKEKDVPACTEEIPIPPCLSKRDACPHPNVTLTKEEFRCSQNDNSNRSRSWTPELDSSSLVSSSDRRLSSRSSAITDDEDSLSCKEDAVRDKQALKARILSQRTKAADDSEVKLEKSVPSLTRSLSATNIVSSLSVSASQEEDSRKKVGKATVIRRPSIARLRALFERTVSTDSDEPSGEVRRKRPIFRSYSQRVTPNEPAIAHTPNVMEKPSSKQKQTLLERKTLGPSARKAREFRELEKSQKSLCSDPSKDAAGRAELSSTATGGGTFGGQNFGSSSGLHGSTSLSKHENRKASVHKSSSRSISNVMTESGNRRCDEGPSAAPQARDLELTSSSIAPSAYGPPPTLPTKKRTTKAMYNPVPVRLSEARRKSQTLPSKGLESCPSAVPSKLSLYDFLPFSSSRAKVPPCLPPKRAKPLQGHLQPVPLLALNNTYVNVLDVLAAKRELLARLQEGHHRFEGQCYTNASWEGNTAQADHTLHQHDSMAAVDTTPKQLAGGQNTSDSQYEHIWYESRPRGTQERDTDTSCSADSGVLPGEQRSTTCHHAPLQGRSATLPSVFRTSSCIVEGTHLPASDSCGRREGHGYSSADTSDIYGTTADEQTCSGTDHDTIFVESSDTAGTDVPLDEGPGKPPGVSNMAPSLSGDSFPQEMTLGVTPKNHLMSTELCPVAHGKTRPVFSQTSFYEHVYPPAQRSEPLALSARVVEEDLLPEIPPPKPPRTFEHGKFDRGRLIVSVVSPKKPPLERHCDDKASLWSKPKRDVAGCTASILNCHPLHTAREGYENIYAEGMVSFATEEAERRMRWASTTAGQRHLECRPTLELVRPVPPDSCKSLQHSLSDASVYEASRAARWHPDVIEHSDSSYAVVRKQRRHVVNVSALNDQCNKLSEVSNRPSAPPRVRRQVERLETRGNNQDASKCTAWKEDVSGIGLPPAQSGPAPMPKGKVSLVASKDNSGNESGSISGTLSKAFGKLNPFSKASSFSTADSKKKTVPLKSVVKKPAIPQKPQTVISLAMAGTPPQATSRPPQVSSSKDVEPVSPGAPTEEHWTRV